MKPCKCGNPIPQTEYFCSQKCEESCQADDCTNEIGDNDDGLCEECAFERACGRADDLMDRMKEGD